MTANKIVEIMARAFVESIEKNPDDIVQDGLRRWEAWAPHIRDQLAELRDAGLAVVQGPYIQVTDHGEGSYTMKATVPEGYALVPVEPVYQGLASKLWEATKTDWQATIKHVLTEPTCPTVVLVPEDPSYPTVRAGADDIDEAVRLACERALAMISAAQEGGEDG